MHLIVSGGYCLENVEKYGKKFRVDTTGSGGIPHGQLRLDWDLND